MIEPNTYDVATDLDLSFALPEVFASPIACFSFDGYQIIDQETDSTPYYLTV